MTFLDLAAPDRRPPSTVFLLPHKPILSDPHDPDASTPHDGGIFDIPPFLYRALL
jgi:hypothetical protein